jgi:hypothetical protein
MLLGYTRWENFAKVIEKAKTACSASGNDIGDLFLDITKMIDLGKGATQKVPDTISLERVFNSSAMRGEQDTAAWRKRLERRDG